MSRSFYFVVVRVITRHLFYTRTVLRTSPQCTVNEVMDCTTTRAVCCQIPQEEDVHCFKRSK